jgi:hypothetical protein
MTSTLKDISTLIKQYLSDESDFHKQAIAVELCSRGFPVWQHYTDAVELVRLLFALATGKNARTPADVRSAARQAALQVAAVNSPLFITTLSSDVLHTREPAQRNATLRLVAFMVRKVRSEWSRIERLV